MDDALRAVPRQERSARSIDRILDAAHRLASDEGLGQLTIGRVAKEAGVSAGKVYYWFEDKDALLAAAGARCRENFEQFLREALDFVDIGDASGLVDNYVRGFAAYMIERPADLDLLDHSRSVDGTNPFRDLMVDLVVPLLEHRVPDLAEGEARFVVRNLISVMVAMTHDVVRAPAAEQPAMVTEMVYLLYGYLHSRYPHESDQVWADEGYPLRPARKVVDVMRSRPVWPAAF